MTYQKLLTEFSPGRHQSVCVTPGVDIRAAQYANHAPIGLSETVIAGADYPLILMKDGDSGQFRLAALFGFAVGQNLFVHSGQWQATYLPVNAQSWPFYFGGVDRILCIDENSEHVATDAGEPLYDGDGQETPFLNLVKSRADYHREDLRAADDFAYAINVEKLVSPVKLALEFEGGREEIIDGLYSVNPQSMSALSGGDLSELHVKGYLGAAFAMVNSLSQMNRLQQLYNYKSDNKIARIRKEIRA